MSVIKPKLWSKLDSRKGQEEPGIEVASGQSQRAPKTN